MYKKTLKRNKGITLIALVVTIIVLLILAGIVIMMLTGQNGILNRASKARDMTGTAQEEEQVKLLAMEVTTQTFNIHDNLTQDILDKAIKNQFGKDGGEGEIISDGYNVTVKKTGNVYQIKDGVVEKVPNKEDLKVDEHPGELEKVGEHTWQINSIEDLVALSYEVASGQNSYEGETVELGRDLWFTGEFNSYRNEDAIYVEDNYGFRPDDSGETTIKDFMIKTRGFIGIGKDENSYKGSFDGKNHGLYNAKLESKNRLYGIFANITAEQDIEFKNFTLGQGIKGVESAQNYGIIANLNGSGKVNISYVKNNFEIDNSATYNGGIIGSVEGSVKLDLNNCHNTTVIKGSYQGGLIGCVNGENIDVNISNSSNLEPQKETSISMGGGAISGILAVNNVNISNFRNNVNIQNNGSSSSIYGGVLGAVWNSNSIVLKDIVSEGNIKNNDCGTISGGIGIIMYGSGDINTIDIDNVINKLNIEKASSGTGIISLVSKSNEMNIRNCTNYGKMTDCNTSSGILGDISCDNTVSLSNCKNNGEISGEKKHNIAGGIIALMHTAKKLNIKECSNNNNISNYKSIRRNIST